MISNLLIGVSNVYLHNKYNQDKYQKSDMKLYYK